MSKKRGNCKKYGRSKSTGKCRARPAPGRRGSKLHRRGKKIGGTYKVACAGRRVYASGSPDSAKAAAAAASKRGANCVVFTKTSRVATYAHGKQA